MRCKLLVLMVVLHCILPDAVQNSFCLAAFESPQPKPSIYRQQEARKIINLYMSIYVYILATASFRITDVSIL